MFDKDDWDISDKTFNWKDGKAHPYFSLNSETGLCYLIVTSYPRDLKHDLFWNVKTFHCRNDHYEAWCERGKVFPAVQSV